MIAGLTTIEEGSVDGESMTLTSKDIARWSFANDVAVTKVNDAIVLFTFAFFVKTLTIVTVVVLALLSLSTFLLFGQSRFPGVVMRIE